MAAGDQHETPFGTITERQPFVRESSTLVADERGDPPVGPPAVNVRVKRCEVCMFFQARMESPPPLMSGTCRVLPPVPVYGFPIVQPDDWCASFMAAP